MANTTRNCVLVVDDDADFRDLVSILVSDWDLTVLEASDCSSALLVLEREACRVCAVLLDYFMPGVDPRVCAQEIVARLDPDVPVVLVSAAVDIAERARELKLDRFLAKPFEMNQLQAMLGMVAASNG